MVYQPSKAIHPGVTVQRTLDSLGMTQKRLAERTGLSEKHISQIINGEASITADTAFLLQNAVGGAASFWLNLDKNHRETLARIEQDERAAQEESLVAQFPYSELVKRNKVSKTLKKSERVLELWRFFGVNSLTSIPDIEVAAYRKGQTDESKQGAIAAWLRCGEIEFMEYKNIELAEYDQSSLRKLLPKLREMTQIMGNGFFEATQKMLAEVGVGLVAVQYFPGTKASGATRWIGGKPLVQVSTYGRDADKMWFTLFHEIGHVLLHGKKDQFISFTDDGKSPDEMQADAFAASTLIPDNVYRAFIVKQDFSELAIKKFAKEQKINPGIVVGRLKNDKWLTFGSYQHLHTKLEMN
ncbi:addiction module antidote protein, HigA family [Candidatus Saccharibacteria bacterium 32-49-12]|nr:MAG: addiction module antidote protein, HigA family [Candidatus Saccharibacteria bacterium 32-49-12]